MTWKGENSFSLLNAGKQLQDTNGKKRKSLSWEHQISKQLILER